MGRMPEDQRRKGQPSGHSVRYRLEKDYLRIITGTSKYMSNIKTKAKEFFNNLPVDHNMSIPDIAAFAESEALLARKEERGACAKAMCDRCSNTEKFHAAELFSGPVYFGWKHRTIHGGHTLTCDAAAIHQRNEEVEG